MLMILWFNVQGPHFVMLIMLLHVILKIENLSLWFNSNRLKINVDKSLNIGNPPHGPFVNDKILDISSNYKYLGLTVTVDSNLSWNKHVQELCCKLGARVGVLYRIS